MIKHWQEQINGARLAGTFLIPVGGGSKRWFGRSILGQTIETSGYTGVVDYDPCELFIRVRAGTPLVEIDSLLSEQQQMLAFEPPLLAGATIGGVVASGLAGPRSASAGSVRDFVIGARMLDGRAQHLAFGGQVMKNVAGYDVSRLLVGSMGSLGLLTEVVVKVLPRPAEERTLRLSMGADAAINQLSYWRGKALPISGSAWFAGELYIRLSGSSPAVAAATEIIGGEQCQEGEPWCRLRNYDYQERASLPGVNLAPVDGERGELYRVTVPVKTPANPKGEMLIESFGAQRWYWNPDITKLSAWVAQCGGHLCRFRGASDSEVWPQLSGIELQLQRALKTQFDPFGLFSPGRIHSQL